MRRCLAVFLLQFVLAAASAQEPAGLSLQGHVYADDTGVPAPGASVILTEDSILFRRRAGVTTTDEHGAFQFSGLTQASYALHVEKTNFLLEYVASAAPAKDIVIRLRRGGVISGKVTGMDGELIGKALVEVMTKSYMYGGVSLLSAGFVWTDDRGMYRVSGLAPGRYYVRSSNDGYDTILYPGASGLAGAQIIDMTAGVEKDAIDLQLRRAQRFTLEGRLLDSETRRLAQAKFLRAESADLVAGTSVGGVVHDGRFRLEGLKPGRYFLTFQWVGATNNVTRTAVFPYEMGDADEDGVVLRAMRASVAGRIKAAREKLTGPLSVHLEPTAAAIRAHISGSAADADVAADGTFKMTGVQPGEYSLRVHSGEPARFFVPERNLITDGRTPIAGIELELDFSAGTVSGKAIDATGRPIPGATVVLQSADSGKLADE